MISNVGFFQQFYKLPVLLEHFSEHKKLHNVSFIDFLEMHYWGEDRNDDDDDRDLQLPFKSSCGHIFHAVFVPADKHYVSTTIRIGFKPAVIIPYTANLHAKPTLFAVFRPPVA